MPLYKLTYQFEPSGGNIEYQTTQQVQKEADTTDIDATLVTTGLTLTSEDIKGIAIIEVDTNVGPTDVFESATTVRQVSPGDKPVMSTTETDQEPADDPRPDDDISRFKESEELASLLADVNETPGHGFILYSNLTRCRPYERDLWLVATQNTEISANTGLTATDVVEFYRNNLNMLKEEPSLKIGCFNRVAEPTMQLFLVTSFMDPQEAREFAARTEGRGAMNFYRFELTKASLVVGGGTHGPGHVDAEFRAPSGDEVRSRELAYRIWHEGLDTYSHPLGIIVDGTLHRPVVHPDEEATATNVGDPIPVETYRGSDGKPWQFGVTRHDGQLLITQARAGPEKFDPILKRFPIESQAIRDEPLVFSHTADRRIWSEDPINTEIQSHRSESLQTQFLYADSDGWHLIQPKALGDPSKSSDSSFEPTQLDGVTVRSSLLRAETDGEMKATVEHEYRIAGYALDSCSCLYALSYHEANEESIDRLEWEIADATAYEIIRDESPPR